MALEIHRRSEVADTEVRMVKVFPKWLTVDQYEDIPHTEAAALCQALIETLPTPTLTELVRLLALHAAKSDGSS